MPVDIRPPLRLSLLHYPDAFDQEMTFQLRERNTASLEEMQGFGSEFVEQKFQANGIREI
jgi:hypothetical protein